MKEKRSEGGSGFEAVEGNNVDDRYFIAFTKSDWINAFEQNEFIINDILENHDATDRDIMWYSFLMETK